MPILHTPSFLLPYMEYGGLPSFYAVHYNITMPPRRRRGDQDEGKPMGKKKKEVTYDTYDEAMDGMSLRLVRSVTS
jgi:hypothetical protein